MENNANLYLLFYCHSHFCCGVYPSKNELQKAVDHYKNSVLGVTGFIWELWHLGDLIGPYEIDWAYINPEANIGDVVNRNHWSLLIPKKEFWGKNLVESRYDAYDFDSLKKEWQENSTVGLLVPYFKFEIMGGKG